MGVACIFNEVIQDHNCSIHKVMGVMVIMPSLGKFPSFLFLFIVDLARGNIIHYPTTVPTFPSFLLLVFSFRQGIKLAFCLHNRDLLISFVQLLGDPDYFGPC